MSHHDSKRFVIAPPGRRWPVATGSGSQPRPPWPWGAFQERRKRERLRAELSSLSDLELEDIAIAHGEIDDVACEPHHRPPRGIRSIAPMNV